MATTLSSDDPVLRQIYRDFISGCHILHYHRVVDAYGHLSVRHPHHADRFIMSTFIAPATISSERDLIEYYIENAEPVNPASPKGYSERCIHSEILKRFPSVNAVIHSHSESVIPYTISGVPFQPCFHMAGFLGTATPVFDIGKIYQPGDRKDMLVSNIRFGEALAGHFGSQGGEPEHAVVLMRGHGLTVQGSSIMDAIMRAVYTQQNASIQTTTLLTRAAHFGVSAPSSVPGASQTSSDGIVYLSREETEGSTEMSTWSVARPWRLWLREVEAQGLYVNTA